MVETKVKLCHLVFITVAARGTAEWLMNGVFDPSTIVNHSGLTSLCECFSLLIFSPRDKADPFTFHLNLFKQTWPSLSCHGPWKGHYTAYPPASFPTASMEARLSRTDTKIEWVTQWQNRKGRLVNWIEPFYPQRKGRCQASRGFETVKGEKLKCEKARLERSSDEIQRDLTCSLARSGQQKPSRYQKNTGTKMKFSSVWSKLHLMETLQAKNTDWKKRLRIYSDV